MIFRTKIKAERVVEEFLECRECGKTMFTEHEFCSHCEDEELAWLSSYTVYQTVFAVDESDAIETALQIDNWKSISGKIVVKEEVK